MYLGCHELTSALDPSHLPFETSSAPTPVSLLHSPRLYHSPMAEQYSSQTRFSQAVDHQSSPAFLCLCKLINLYVWRHRHWIAGWPIAEDRKDVKLLVWQHGGSGQGRSLQNLQVLRITNALWNIGDCRFAPTSTRGRHKYWWGRSSGSWLFRMVVDKYLATTCGCCLP